MNHDAADASKLDLSSFKSQLGFRNKLIRLLWGLTSAITFRPFPRSMFLWRRLLLRCFGAKIGKNVRVYGSARIYYPPNLHLADNVVIGPDVDCYCVAPIEIQANSMISQYAYLCAATHDYTLPQLPLIAKPILVKSDAWVCAAAFIGPGVTIGQGSVVGARACVFKDVPQWTVVAGNPAKEIKKRVLKSNGQAIGV
jgi:putative colanic acid biosynthesis acetyltransferase WcaF